MLTMYIKEGRKQVLIMVQDVLKKANKISALNIKDDKTGETIFNLPIWAVALVAIVVFSLIRLRKARSS